MCYISLSIALIVLLVLVFVVRSRSEGVKDKRNFKLYTSGATMRQIGSKFSSSDQVQPVVLHADGAVKPIALGLGSAQGGIVNADIGVPLNDSNHFYTSGATMRVLDQVFTSVDQAPDVEVHNMDDPDSPPMYLKAALIGK